MKYNRKYRALFSAHFTLLFLASIAAYYRDLKLEQMNHWGLLRTNFSSEKSA